jgi:hypothetical protein
MNFDDIKKVNETLRTLDVKGKAYVEVNERIKAFRMLFPEGTIETEILSLMDGVVTMKATVSVDGKVLGVGHAQEKEESSFINKTSFVENCETSAVGRALGMVGIGIDTSVASAEEVENAILNQNKHICAACGKEIKDGKKTDGSVWSASDIAAYTLRKFGKELCVDCGTKEGKKNA